MHGIGNLGFISHGKDFLLWLIALPAWFAWKNAVDFSTLDVAATMRFLVSLVVKFANDPQRWNFHQNKMRRMQAGETEDKGFWAPEIIGVSSSYQLFL